MALANAGCTVESVCPSGHPLDKTKSLRPRYVYNGLTPLKSFAAAIAETKPDLIVPGDDLAARHLHDLYDRARRRGKASEPICALIERSLGASASFPVVSERATFIKLAQEEGIRVPNTEVISNLNELREWVARMGLPMVLKADNTSGGDGVRIAHTLEDAECAFRKLQAPPLLARAAKRALIDHDPTLVLPSLLRRRSVVNAQTYVAGREATSTIACWKGTVLASLHFAVINKAQQTGHATVVRLLENPEMSLAAERMVRRLNLSGLHGLDFLIETDTGNAYLIEINPRATQVGHLTLGPGRDFLPPYTQPCPGKLFKRHQRLRKTTRSLFFPRNGLEIRKANFYMPGITIFRGKSPSWSVPASAAVVSRAPGIHIKTRSRPFRRRAYLVDSHSEERSCCAS